MKIDMFTYYNETELLDFHINHVDKYVDKIIVVEGDRTYDGRPYTSEFRTDNPKVEHHIVPLLADPTDRWENEALQRRLAGDIAQRYKGTLYFECADEIINPAWYKHDFKEPHCLSLDNYYYYFNGKDVGDKSDHPMPIVLSTDSYDDLHGAWENRHSFQTVPNAGWHFSYLGGVDKIKQKLEAYSHSEYDNDFIKTNLEKNIQAGNDIFSRDDHKFEFVKIDNSFPEELVNNQDKYRGLIMEVEHADKK